MPGVYERLGIRFLYPDNWSIQDEQADQWPQTVSAQSAGSGFWSLQIFPATDPQELVAEVLREMRLEYAGLEAEQVAERLGPVEMVGYDMDFYCLDMVITSQTRGFSSGDRTFLLMVQAEDREFQELARVFQAITTSLLQGLQEDRGRRAEG